MSKFQVPSSNGVGCGDDTDRHTHTYSHEPNSEESLLYFWLFMSMFCVNRIGLEVKAVSNITTILLIFDGQ